MNRHERRAAAKLNKLPHISKGPAPRQASKASELMAAGLAHHRAGQIGEAEACYRQAVAIDRNRGDAFHLLGVIAFQAGQLQSCVDLIAKAIQREGNNPFYLSDLGNALQALGRFDEAVASYDRAIALKPHYAEALYNRGIAFRKLKRLDDALASYDEAIAIRPDYAEAHSHRGHVLGELKRTEEAVAACNRALALRPNYFEALFNLGNALQAQARFKEALDSYNAALAVGAKTAETFYNRANALQALKRLDEAVASYDEALVLNPAYAEAFVNRGNTLRELKRLEEALASFDRALILEPDLFEALHNRAATLQDMNRLDEALDHYEKAFGTPSGASAFTGMLWCVGALCLWDRRAKLKGHISKQTSRIAPLTFLSYSDDPERQLLCAREFVASIVPASPPMPSKVTSIKDKVRIAYLSADFREHPVAYLTAELFEGHDRFLFEVTAISFGPDDGSAMRKRLAAAFDRFIDVRGVSDEDAAYELLHHEIDIAVDLMGHTRDARLGILSRRGAPVQASYLGYPGTMGAPFIDYIIADSTVTPFEHQKFYAEKIVQLPDCYLVSDSTRGDGAPTPPRREVGLPEKGFVFCCFNQMWKLTPERFDIWMRLLQAVEGSILWLRFDNATAEGNLRLEAQKRGVDPGRLVFARHVPSSTEHLARLHLADLFLDTLPYNAHTTASDALWASVPVVTQLGQAFAGRVAASLLKAIGLPELVTHCAADYEALALRLAQDQGLLASFRDRLKANRVTHPLFDVERFRRHVEAAYLHMAETARRGEKPRAFRIEPGGRCLPR